MNDKMKKTLILNTLILCFCVVIIALFSMVPNKSLENEVETYTISFDTNGGSSVAAVKIDENGRIVLPENPTKEGYIFMGWYLNGEPFDANMEITGDVTLTATWKEIDTSKNYYTVTFNTDGGTPISSQMVEEGELVIRPQDPIKDGFQFVDWTVDGFSYTFQEPVTRDFELVAVYEKVDVPAGTKTYTVRFSAGGGVLGSGCGAQTIPEGEKANPSCNVSRSGYTFNGWNPNIDSAINKNTTFTAQWTADPTPPPPAIVYYSLTYHANGGTLSGTCNRQVAEGTVPGNSCTASRQFYNFDGWSPSTGSAVHSNMNYYASWSKQKVKVNFSAVDNGLGGITGYNLSVSGVSNSSISSLSLTFTLAGSKITKDYASTMYLDLPMIYDSIESCSIIINGDDFQCTK